MGDTSPQLRRLGRAGPNAGEMELLRAATLDAERASAAWRRWVATHDVDTAFHRSTDILPSVGANVPAEVLGREADRLRGLRRRVWAEDQYHLLALAEATRLLQGAGIEPIVAKGAALATTVYPQPGTRKMADTDLIVGLEPFDAACGVLEDAGWRQIDPVDGPFFHALAFRDPGGRDVDLHRWIVFPRFSPVPELAWFDRAVPHTIRGTTLRRLSGPDELVLAVLHGLLTNTASATRWPLDATALCRRSDAAFWDGVIGSAREVLAGPVVADALDMCRAELAAPVPVEAIDALRRSPVDGGLALHWRLCRRGVNLEWRLRRYARIERAAGRRPTPSGYLRPRVDSLRRRGLGTVVAGRVDRARNIVKVRTRD